MASLQPLSIRLVKAEWVGETPSPAYDALSPRQRRAHIDKHPLSYLTVTRGPEDLPAGTVWDKQIATDSARKALARLLDAEVFSDLHHNSIFVYRLIDEHHTQVAIVSGVDVADYHSGVVRPHEQLVQTRAQVLADQLQVVRTQSSPIAMAHRPNPLIGEITKQIIDTSLPALDFVTEDNLTQQVWVVTDPETIDKVRSALADEHLHVIDGHHRAAAAAAPGSNLSDDSQWMLCALFPSDQLRNIAFHRCLSSVDTDALLSDLAERFAVRQATTLDEVNERADDELALFADGRWYLVPIAVPTPITADDTDLSDTNDLDNRAQRALENLDSVRLQTEVLGPILDLQPGQASGHLDYISGAGDLDDLEQISETDRGAVWIMRPVPMDVFLLVSESSLTLPPKSTYFVPKARSGIFLRQLG